tara:strand:- start:836 stop:1501 length:666 start_codon:yes stop_codon:yes gene_type:complete
MRTISAAITLLALSQLFACGETKTSTLNHALQEYSNNQWLMSEMWAKKTIENEKDIHEAQYLMGLCEFQLQNIDSSKSWFMKAAKSENAEVKGKSTAMLGIIASSKGDYQTAKLAFSNASTNLIGIDKQIAEERSGGKSISNNFTLQFGAYRNRVNAEKAIISLENSLQNAGIGTAWITEERSNSGRTMYLVQAGHFRSRNSASLQRDRTNLPQCIVAVIP